LQVEVTTTVVVMFLVKMATDVRVAMTVVTKAMTAEKRLTTAAMTTRGERERQMMTTGMEESSGRGL